MSLKKLVGEKVLNDVIRSVKTPGQWRVLVVDTLGMRVISTCCKMRDIVMEGVTIVEDLNKGRESLPLEAIYFIAPTENSVQLIIDDFKDANKPQYSGAHIFFTETCPEKLFESIAKASNLGRRIRTLQEINIAYLPTEMQVFSLDNRDALPHLYSHNSSVVREKRPICVEQIAEQLATLCASLGEYPSIRYRYSSQVSVDIAQALMNRLQAYKADDPSMGEGPQKQQSQIIILDRGFDLVSPLLHELTYQAMVYDLLDIENDVYKYEVQSGGDYILKEAILDENDEQWIKLRHKHIANVSTQINTMVKEFAESKRLPGTKDATTIKDLSQLLKKMPQYQKELSKYSLHINLAEECFRFYNEHQIEKLCAVEQDLATGVDKGGEKISKDHMRSIVPVLLDQHISQNNKLRIILLYAIMKQGITEESMNKLMEHAKISSVGRNTIKNVANLDVTIIQDSERGNKKKSLPVRKERTGEFQLSRYVPYVKDLMEDAVEGKLDSKMFPYIMKREGGSMMAGAGTSARSARMYSNWHKDKSQVENTRSLPRLIVFVVGGASYSEARCAYEVTQASKTWEVIIGGTELLTPDGFLYRILSLG